VANERRGREDYSLAYVRVPPGAWDHIGTPGAVLNALRTIGVPPITFRALVFTMEGWMVSGKGKPPEYQAEVARLGAERKLSTHPDRVSVRTTIGVSTVDEIVYLLHEQGGDEVTLTDGDSEDGLMSARNSEVIVQLRHLVGRMQGEIDSRA
jgi:hypothetical protein